MSTYSDHEQRKLDQQSGEEMDKRAVHRGKYTLIPVTELTTLRADLVLATRLLRLAVTELQHHVCYDDAETMEFLNRESSNG